MKIAVQLVAWNGETFLAECLASLQGQSFRDWQIFILDNHSNDNSASIIKSWLSAARGELKELAQNIGFAAGHNMLLESHNAPYVLVLNQDVYLEPDYLKELVNCLEAHSKTASATGCLFRWELADNRLTKTDILDSAGLKIYRTYRVAERGRGKKDQFQGAPEEVFGAPATAALYRRRALDEIAIKTADGVEWFDNDFGSYKEDVDLAYRLQLAGWQSMYAPAARAYHYRGLRGAADADRAFFSFAAWRQRQNKSALANRLSYRNHLFFLCKSFAFRIFSLTWWATFLYEFFKATALAFGEPKTFWFAWSELWRHRARLKMKRRQILLKHYDSANIKRFF